MPATNPFIDFFDGSGVVYTPDVGALFQQSPVPAASTTAGPAVNPASASQVNAAGTSEKVNQHVAITVVLLGLGVIGLNKLGFKFAGTASVGVGR